MGGHARDVGEGPSLEHIEGKEIDKWGHTAALSR